MSHGQHSSSGVTTHVGLFGQKYDKRYVDTTGSMQHSNHMVLKDRESQQRSNRVLSA
jgi:hypothetical protein